MPEFAIRHQTLIYGIPEFFLEQPRIVLSLPQITVKHVSAEISDVQDESTELSREAKAELDSLVAGMQSDLHKACAGKLHGPFQCQRTNVSNSGDLALGQIDREIATTQAPVQTAHASHAESQATAADAVVQQLGVSRVAIAAQFDEAVKQIDDAEQKSQGMLDTKVAHGTIAGSSQS